MKAYRELYSNISDDFEYYFIHSFKQSFKDIESSFIKYLESVKVNSNIFEVLEKELENRKLVKEI
ncbi:hypothetical protein [Sporosalibacterium faouarense]|uniref:hypothetical protein n=1 Tax=Sporosalibacterium faouarense TaxID=516123 RepID=UPI00192C3002|nr:hypothetical protein [Sporosalibacterium faouarense]